MIRERLGRDIFYIPVALTIFATINLIIDYVLEHTRIFTVDSSSKVVFIISIILYLISVLYFLIFAWKLRRWSILNNQDEKENVLKHVFTYFFPVFALILIYTLVIYLSSLKYIIILDYISKYFLQYFQIALLSTLIGIFFYPKMEKHLGLLFYDEVILPDQTKLGLGTVIQQTEFSVKKYWTSIMIIAAAMIAVANIIVFIVYPLIPSTSIAEGLSFTFPNFDYTYKAELGFRQEFFISTEIPPSAIVDWKLAQSLMCIALIAIFVLLVYFPRKMKDSVASEEKSSEEIS
ncbi:MAG: hypothetical protein ACXABK_04670 [Candidatus Heimdallarchaeaceae archaeon]|jgi:hypothetical protein